MIIILLLLGLVNHLPGVDTPAPSPRPSAIDPGVSFRELGCVCEETVHNGYRCDALPAFGDNDWKNARTREFATRATDFSAKVETILEGFRGNYQLALQGWADRRQIGREKQKRWGDAHDDCRLKHSVSDLVNNSDLAFLRACELRRALPPSLASNVDLLKPIDFTNPAMRLNKNKTYAGDNFKTVVLFITFPDKEVCKNEIQPTVHY